MTDPKMETPARLVCPIHGEKGMHGDTLLCMECGKLVDAPSPEAEPADTQTDKGDK